MNWNALETKSETATLPCIFYKKTVVGIEQVYDWLFEPLLVVLCVLLGVSSSLQDARREKIGNRLIFSFMAMAAIVHVPLILGNANNREYLFFAALNFLFSALAGFILWEWKVWTAGDAKLFAAFSALVPLSTYKNGYLPLFPSFALLANTLVPIAIVFCAFLFLKTDSAEKLEVFRRAVKPIEMMQVAFLAFGISLVSALLQLGAQDGVLKSGFFGLAAVLLFFALRKFAKPENVTFLSLVASALGLGASVFLGQSSLELLGLPLLVAAIATGIAVAAAFFAKLSEFWFNGVVRISELESGMQPLEGVFETNKGFCKRALAAREGIEGLRAVLELPNGILSQKDIGEIRRLRAAKKINFDGLSVKQTLPFAPLLFAGVIATFLMQGSLFSVVLKMLG